MKTSVLATQHNQIVAQRNLLLIVSGSSIVLNLMLGGINYYMVGRERIIISPPVVNSQFWVTSDSVSDSYLEQMSEFYAGLVLNVTPNNFASRSQQLIQHVDPGTYSVVKAQMVEQQSEITRRAMSTSFHPVSFKIDRKNLLVEIKGELRVTMGNSQMESKSKTYQIQFNHRHSRLYIKQFKEVTND